MNVEDASVIHEEANVDLALPFDVCSLPAFDRALLPQVRDVRLLTSPPWVRSLGKLALEVSTQGWKFPTPPQPAEPADEKRPALRLAEAPEAEEAGQPAGQIPSRTRLVPPRDAVLFKD